MSDPRITALAEAVAAIEPDRPGTAYARIQRLGAALRSEGDNPAARAEAAALLARLAAAIDDAVS